METIEENSEEYDSDSIDVTKQIKDAKLKALVQKRDPDMDSVENSSQVKERPSNVRITSDSSVASSITNFSMQSVASDESISSNYSCSSKDSTVANSNKSSGKSTGSSKRSKYELTTNMIEYIHNGSEEDISEEELRRRVLAYQEVKIQEAKQVAEAEVAKYVKKKKQQFLSSTDAKDSENSNAEKAPAIEFDSDKKESGNKPPATPSPLKEPPKSQDNTPKFLPQTQTTPISLKSTIESPPKIVKQTETEKNGYNPSPSTMKVNAEISKETSKSPSGIMSYSQALRTPTKETTQVSPDTRSNSKNIKQQQKQNNSKETTNSSSNNNSNIRKSQRLKNKDLSSSSTRAGSVNTGKEK